MMLPPTLQFLNKRFVLLAVFTFFAIILSACGDDGGSKSGGSLSSQYKGSIEEEVFIYGNHNNVPYPINVYLPEGYGDDPDQRYPVLYLLDSEWWFLPTVGLVDDSGKPIIVVGIGNVDQMTQGLRAIDYRLPGALDYYNFLTTQVISYIDASYATDTSQRTLSGHSYGGLFTGLTLLMESPNNRYFNQYLSQDGSYWYLTSLIAALEEQLYLLDTVLPVKVIISGATGERGNAFYAYWFYRALQLRGYSQLDIEYMQFNTNHTDEFLLSMSRALPLLYPD